MGLISDYLEEYRDNVRDSLLDPCMILPAGIRTAYSSCNELQEKLTVLAKLSNQSQKSKLYHQLTAEYQKLEYLKLNYILSEKVVLGAYNSRAFLSHLVEDTVSLLLGELRKTYHGICQVIHQIEKELGKIPAVATPSPNEKALSNKMMHLICTSIISALQEQTAPLDTSTFRKVISDLAAMINYLENESYHQPDKKIVRYYLEKEFNMYPGSIVCCNCHEKLLDGLPYCLNCYERN